MKEVFFSDYLRKKAKKEPCGLRCLGRDRPDSSTHWNYHRRRHHPCIRHGRHHDRPFRRGHARSRPIRLIGAESGASRSLRAHLLSSGLSDDYTAYYNLPLNGNGRISDIDCILVGPSGLFVFEVKHHHGLILYRNGIWARIKVGRRELFIGVSSETLPVNYTATSESSRSCSGSTDGLWLHGAVVFTNPRAVLDIEGLRWVRAIAVKDLEQILSRRTVLSAEQIDSINARLSALVKK